MPSLALILVATLAERDAVLKAVGDVTGEGPQHDWYGAHTVFRLGTLNGSEVLLAQSAEQGGLGPGAMLLTANSLLTDCRPDYLILTGLCYGLREDSQRLGDIVVSRNIQELDHQRVVDRDGEATVLRRGARVQASVLLVDRFTAATVGWTEPAAVQIGLMLSANTLVDSATYRARAKEEFPDALAGEMESASVYAASAKDKVDWIVVKAISDWGQGKTDDCHELAATNAARFVVHTIMRGGLPEQRRSPAAGPRGARR